MNLKTAIGGLTLFTLAFTKTIYTWPNIIPSGIWSIGNKLINSTGVDSIEHSSDLEMLFIIAISFILSAALVSLIEVAINSRQRSKK